MFGQIAKLYFLQWGAQEVLAQWPADLCTLRLLSLSLAPMMCMYLNIISVILRAADTSGHLQSVAYAIRQKKQRHEHNTIA